MFLGRFILGLAQLANSSPGGPISLGKADLSSMFNLFSLSIASAVLFSGRVGKGLVGITLRMVQGARSSPHMASPFCTSVVDFFRRRKLGDAHFQSPLPCSDWSKQADDRDQRRPQELLRFPMTFHSKIDRSVEAYVDEIILAGVMSTIVSLDLLFLDSIFSGLRPKDDRKEPFRENPVSEKKKGDFVFSSEIIILGRRRDTHIPP